MKIVIIDDTEHVVTLETSVENLKLQLKAESDEEIHQGIVDFTRQGFDETMSDEEVTAYWAEVFREPKPSTDNGWDFDDPNEFHPDPGAKQDGLNDHDQMYQEFWAGKPEEIWADEHPKVEIDTNGEETITLPPGMHFVEGVEMFYQGDHWVADCQVGTDEVPPEEETFPMPRYKFDTTFPDARYLAEVGIGPDIVASCYAQGKEDDKVCYFTMKRADPDWLSFFKQWSKDEPIVMHVAEQSSEVTYHPASELAMTEIEYQS